MAVSAVESAQPLGKSSEPPGSTDELIPLVDRAKGGDMAAARALVLTLSPTLRRIIRGVLGATHPDVEDTLQEATISLFGALRTFRQECSVRTFASSVTLRTALKHRRQLGVRARSSAGSFDDTMDVAGDDERMPSTHLLAARRLSVLRSLLDEIPEAQAEALMLQCALGYSVDEIALTSATPVNTVRSRLRLAREALRQRVASTPALADALELSP